MIANKVSQRLNVQMMFCIMRGCDVCFGYEGGGIRNGKVFNRTEGNETRLDKCWSTCCQPTIAVHATKAQLVVDHNRNDDEGGDAVDEKWDHRMKC
jgi:hypothetical protein